MRSKVCQVLGSAFAIALSFGASQASAQTGPQKPNAPFEHGAAEVITLNVGEQYVLPAQGVKSYSEGSRSIVDVRLTGDSSRFVVVGLVPGSTTLLFLMNDGSERHYRIDVVDPNGGTAKVAVDPLAVAPQVNVRLDLYFVQVDRSYSHTIGMNVPTTVATGTFSAAFDLTRAALISNSAIVGTELLPQLELAQTQGWAKVSRHVAVITSNGTEAEFDSGGEFNVQVVQGLTANVTSIKFGSVLGVKPRYDQSTGRIELTVDAQVADLTSTGAAVPGRNRSSVSTVVNLALGESLAVAGLSSHTRERQMGGLAGLSQIPIIGFLFGRQGAREQDIDNLVFIVPTVVEPMRGSRSKEFMRDALRQYEQYDGDFDDVQPFLPSAEAMESKQPSSPKTSASVSREEPRHANAKRR